MMLMPPVTMSLVAVRKQASAVTHTFSVLKLIVCVMCPFTAFHLRVFLMTSRYSGKPFDAFSQAAGPSQNTHHSWSRHPVLHLPLAAGVHTGI